MKLLAIETATEACSVALWIDGEVRERFGVAPRQHAELALPWAGQLLADAGVARSQLDAIAARNQKAMPAKAKGKTVAQQAPQSFIAANGMLVVAEPLMVDTVATITADGQVVITHGEPQQTVEAANE